MQTEINIFIVVITIVILVFITGIIIFIYQYRNRRILHLRETSQLTEQHQQELLTTQLEMQTQTMQHIGREIHDNVGQKLTLASLYTQQLAYENKAPQVHDKIEHISNIINESLAELRQLSKSLTDDSINNNSIIELLQQECDKVNSVKKCEVMFTSNKKNIGLPYQTKSILLRIVQEFLQNSMKHAGCSKIDVTLIVEENSMQLRLADDGKGFDMAAASGKGIGLNNMSKRTKLIGGAYHLESKEGGYGTRLHINIPL